MTAKMGTVMGTEQKHGKRHPSHQASLGALGMIHAFTLVQASWALDPGPNPRPHPKDLIFDKEDFRLWCPLPSLAPLSGKGAGGKRALLH